MKVTDSAKSAMERAMEHDRTCHQAKARIELIQELRDYLDNEPTLDNLRYKFMSMLQENMNIIFDANKSAEEINRALGKAADDMGIKEALEEG